MKKSKLITSLAAIGIAFLMLPQTVHAAGFVQDAAGIRYQNDDGSYLTNSWVQVGQNIYHLDAAGIVQTGWIQVGNLWYYLDANGICTNPAGTAVAPADVSAAPVQTAPTPAPAAASTPDNIFAAAGWVPFQTADTALLNSGIAAGLIGNDGVQYWAEPTFAAQSANPQTVAQQAAPAAVPQEVWLSATGSKYHRINNCGKMDPKRAIKVTLEEAQSRGKKACSKCF